MSDGNTTSRPGAAGSAGGASAAGGTNTAGPAGSANMAGGAGTPGGASAARRTVVDEGTELRGTLTASCPILVVGRLEGDVTGPSLEIAEAGAVIGNVKVTELRSRGELAGRIEAESVELSGRVREGAVIKARSLAVSLGRRRGEAEVVFGDCELSVGDEPSREQAVAEALGAGKQKGEPAPASAAPPASSATPPAGSPTAPAPSRTAGAPSGTAAGGKGPPDEGEEDPDELRLARSAPPAPTVDAAPTE